MGRFAHLADVHLGYQKHEKLIEMERNSFSRVVSECITGRVDFVLVCGDLFHINIPDMATNVFAFDQFRRLKVAGIPVYAVYGSHDFSPTNKSVIDLLAASGLITKATVPAEGGEGTAIGFITDPKTGAKIAGLPGLKAGVDRKLYENLDREMLEHEDGFKIFLFHGAIGEMMSAADRGESMPISLLPKNFAYYAGGHMHAHRHESYDGYPHAVYPGTTFAGYHRDLEGNAKGTKRGFVIVDFDEKVTDVRFVEIENAEYEMIEMHCENKKADSVESDLRRRVGEIDPKDKIVIIRLAGELASGRASDVDTITKRREMMSAGALDVIVHRNQLASREYDITAARGESRDEIEQNVFAENIGAVRANQPELRGEEGVKLARGLLSEMEQQKQENETEPVYKARISSRTLHRMGLKIDDS